MSVADKRIVSLLCDTLYLFQFQENQTAIKLMKQRMKGSMVTIKKSHKNLWEVSWLKY
jgi:hypothetical protein